MYYQELMSSWYYLLCILNFVDIHARNSDNGYKLIQLVNVIRLTNSMCVHVSQITE